MSKCLEALAQPRPVQDKSLPVVLVAFLRLPEAGSIAQGGFSPTSADSRHSGPGAWENGRPVVVRADG